MIYKKKGVLFFALLVIQLGLIVYLLNHIFLSDEVAIAPLHKTDFNFTQSNEIQNFYEPKPNTTISNFPEWRKTRAENTINSDTLHDRFEYEIEKETGVFRIITIGDSMTYGLYLNTEDNWTEVLEDTLNNQLTCQSIRKFEVINLGVSGYDAQFTAERYQKRGKKYNPDLVLWFVIDRNFMSLVDAFHERYNFFDQNNTDASQTIEDSVRQANEELFMDKNKERIYEIQKSSLDLLAADLEQKLIIFTTQGMLSDSYHKMIYDVIEKHRGVKFTDTIGDLMDIRNIVTKGDQHPNELGSEIIAQDLFKYLTGHQLNCFQ